MVETRLVETTFHLIRNDQVIVDTRLNICCLYEMSNKPNSKGITPLKKAYRCLNYDFTIQTSFVLQPFTDQVLII